MEIIDILMARALGGSRIPDVTQWIGVTTTALADGASTNPIVVNGESVTAVAGDVASYGGSNYVFNGTVWQAAGGSENVAADLNDVIFVDYDGKIRYGYSAAEFASLTEMPSNPIHSGLTAQGWNWALADAKAYVGTYGKLIIGQTYATDDGKTRIYIHLENGRLSPHLGICPNGTVTVSWGDGRTDTVTGTSTTTVVNTQHTYSAAGDYVITLAVDGTMGIAGDDTYGSKLLWKNGSTASENRVYQNAVYKVELGSGITSLASYAFSHCYSLASVTIPSGISSIGSYAFQYCESLVFVSVPSGVTRIDTYTFYSCESLVFVAIPNSVTQINGAFQTARGLVVATIPSGVTSMDSAIFSNCLCLSSVTVPSGVTEFGANLFYSCHNLSDITIPSGVRSIPASAFSSCACLSSVTIPSGVTSIGTNAFSYCTGIREYHMLAATPPTLAAANAFNAIAGDCVIYVPRSTNGSVLAAYQSATNWATYASYMQEEPQ